jgi:hypothetical protein
LGTTDRAIRGVLGILAIASGLLLVGGVVGIAVALVGAVLVLSGATGFCHVRKVLRTSGLRRRQPDGR